MKWVEYLINGLFWLITGWLVTSSFSIQGQEIEIFNGEETIRTIRDDGLINRLVFCLVLSFLMFYSNLANLLRLRHETKRKVFLLSGGILLAALFLNEFVQPAIFRHHLPLPKYINGSIILFYFTISCCYGLIKIWINSERRQTELALAKKQAELTLLRNQLQPHFLFNALNNLLYLVDQKASPQLAESFTKLSDLLRYVIEENKEDKVAIAEEIRFLRNYCDLQLLRFEHDEIDFAFTVSGESEEQLVEPGLFIPFVENAFKYGTEPEKKSTIKIHFDLNKATSVSFLIENEKRKVNASGTGLGIKSIKERLDMVYRDRHTLTMIDGFNYSVQLKIETS